MDLATYVVLLRLGGAGVVVPDELYCVCGPDEFFVAFLALR